MGGKGVCTGSASLRGSIEEWKRDPVSQDDGHKSDDEGLDEAEQEETGGQTDRRASWRVAEAFVRSGRTYRSPVLCRGTVSCRAGSGRALDVIGVDAKGRTKRGRQYTAQTRTRAAVSQLEI